MNTRSSLRALALGLMGTVLALHADAPHARMYQWVNPGTGTAQLSGEPPSWYRASSAGPRVLVFENGFLVDDTAIDVSLVRRLALRERAFEELERRRTLEELARVRDAERKKARREAREASRREAEDDGIVSSVKSTLAGAARAVSEELPDVLDASAIERLKSIISEFDRRGGR